MEEIKNIEKLNQKVSQIIQQYHLSKSENDMLRQEIAALKAKQQLLEVELQRLSDLNTQKDIEIEQIANKIESIIG